MAFTLIGSDDFTEASDTNLQSHTPSGANALGSNWTHLTWQFSASAVVDEATDSVVQPYYVGAGDLFNPYVIGPAANAPAQKVTAKNAKFSGASGSGMLLLAANAGTYWNGYAAGYRTSSGRYIIYRVDDGVRTEITSVTSGFDAEPAASDLLYFSVDASGNFEVGVEGAGATRTASDTTYTTGKPGLGVVKAFTGSGLDEFSAFHEVAAAKPRTPHMTLLGVG